MSLVVHHRAPKAGINGCVGRAPFKSSSVADSHSQADVTWRQRMEAGTQGGRETETAAGSTADRRLQTPQQCSSLLSPPAAAEHRVSIWLSETARLTKRGTVELAHTPEASSHAIATTTKCLRKPYATGGTGRLLPTQTSACHHRQQQCGLFLRQQWKRY